MTDLKDIKKMTPQQRLKELIKLKRNRKKEVEKHELEEKKRKEEFKTVKKELKEIESLIIESSDENLLKKLEETKDEETELERGLKDVEVRYNLHELEPPQIEYASARELYTTARYIEERSEKKGYVSPDYMGVAKQINEELEKRLESTKDFSIDNDIVGSLKMAGQAVSRLEAMYKKTIRESQKYVSK